MTNVTCQPVSFVIYYRMVKTTTDYTEIIGKAVHARLYKSDLREAATQSGVSASTLSRVSNGKAPDLETFRKLCLWLDLSADRLLGLPRYNKP